MRILLDTHCWLWLHTRPARLSDESRAVLADARNELVLSAIVPWEIAIKHARGRLPIARPLDVFLSLAAAAVRTTPLPVEHRHAVHVGTLPLHHRDPFDRMLIAQAQVEGLTILTADPHFRRYDVEVLAA